MRATLEVRSGPDAGRFVTIPPGSEVTVGRKVPAQFVISGDLTLSRAHFALSRAGQGCHLRDLGSTSGTLVNGEGVAEVALKDGDVIEAGSTHFVLRIEADVHPAPPAAPLRPHRTAVVDREDSPTEERGILAAPVESVPDLVLGRLRAQPDPLFAILDAARDPLVLVRLQNSKEQYQSLYEGPKGERLAAAAPYLVSLPARSPFLETLVRESWGKSWGVYLSSTQPFPEVRKHLRRFLTVKTEDGKELLFRFYDPRVLRVFLPTCNPEELGRFFGPIRDYLMEGSESDDLLSFGFEGQRLRKQVIRLDPQPVAPGRAPAEV